MDGLGLSYEEMEKVNPALVVVSITPFGQSGPYKHYRSHEIQPYAFGGPMYFTGNPEREPVNAANNVSDLHTGLAAATAGMVAFHRAEATGEGDYIDIAAAEVQLGNIDRRAAKLLAYSYTGAVGDRNLDHMGIGSGPFPCSDGLYQPARGGVRVRPGVQADRAGGPDGGPAFQHAGREAGPGEHRGDIRV